MLSDAFSGISAKPYCSLFDHSERKSLYEHDVKSSPFLYNPYQRPPNLAW